jgi:hypothetical protein
MMSLDVRAHASNAMPLNHIGISTRDFVVHGIDRSRAGTGKQLPLSMSPTKSISRTTGTLADNVAESNCCLHSNPTGIALDMFQKLTTAACAVDWLLALLLTQAGMFLVGKTHADAARGLATPEYVPGLSAGSLALLALALAVSLILHGLWCWRRFKALGAQHAPKPVEVVLILAAPVAALGIGIVLAILRY